MSMPSDIDCVDCTSFSIKETSPVVPIIADHPIWSGPLRGGTTRTSSAKCPSARNRPELHKPRSHSIIGCDRKVGICCPIFRETAGTTRSTLVGSEGTEQSSSLAACRYQNGHQIQMPQRAQAKRQSFSGGQERLLPPLWGECQDPQGSERFVAFR